MRALWTGRFADVEKLANEALQFGERAQNQNAIVIFAAQMALLRREQDRVAEVEPVVRAFIHQYPSFVSWRCARVLMLAELGCGREAAEQIAMLAVDDFALLPDNMFRLGSLALLTEG